MAISVALPDRFQFLPRFSRLASIAVLSNMMVPLAGLVDTAFLGHLADISHLAGVILASILFDYLYRVLKFLRTSTTALTAQAFGANNAVAVVSAGLRSGVIALAIGLIILAVQYPLQKFGFALLSGSPTVEISGVDYFYGRIWGAPAVLLNFVLIGWFLGQERNGIVLIISLVGNLSNVGLDYLMINRWGWASAGAGMATAWSQYLALAVGLLAIAFSVSWGMIAEALKDFWHRETLKETVLLKGNILIRFLALITTYALFTNLSSSLGTTVLAQNGLLLQIALLSQFTIQGVGMTTQTLTGNFKSKGQTELLGPLIFTSMVTTLLIALGFALGAILYPDLVFGLLTNHEEINRSLTEYSFWLLPLLEITAIAFMLEGYFIGLKEGKILRNGVLIAFFGGYLPWLTAGAYWQNNHFLWLSLVSYMVTLALFLGWQFLTSFAPHSLKELEQTSSLMP